MENTNLIEKVNVENVNEIPKVSKLGILRKLLGEEKGYTKEELVALTSLKLSTINCQIYYHLPNKNFKIEKLEGRKVRFVRE
jgi:hypothetical protein